MTSSITLTTPYKPATQKMVAERAGVSLATVSHILTGRADRYNEETRNKVLKAAKALEYRPHRGAQAMRKGRTNLIGIIHFGIAFEAVLQTANVLPDAVASHGYQILVIDLSWQRDGYSGAVAQLVEARVEGVIISQTREAFGHKHIDILKRAGIPVVIIAGNEELNVPIVYGDVSTGFKQLTTHLLELGHKRLLFLTNHYRSRSSLSRIQGFTDAICEKGGRAPEVETERSVILKWLKEKKGTTEGRVIRITEDPTAGSGPTSYFYGSYHYMQEVIAAGPLPDAILCTNDAWTRGVFAAALEAGLSIPRDMAVTGFDDEAFGHFAPYYLTTVAHPRKEECLKAVEILMDLIRGKTPQEQQTILPCRLVIRSSCGTPRQS